MGKRQEPPQPTIFEELGKHKIKEGKYGPTDLKAQVLKYGDNGEPGLNLQSFFVNADGETGFGKRPLLTLDMLKFIRDEDLINKAIEAIENQDK